MANDLFSALRTYLMKIGNGEKTPQELAAALNHWARESGEAIKARVEDEVKKNVAKMGFAKEADLLRLEKELSKELRELKELLKVRDVSERKKSSLKKTSSATNGTRKKPAKKSPTKKKNGK